jgi:hypothetical protein
MSNAPLQRTHVASFVASFAALFTFGHGAPANAQTAALYEDSVRAAEERSAECDRIEKDRVTAGTVCVAAANAWLEAGSAAQRAAIAAATETERAQFAQNAAAARNNAVAYLLDARDCTRAMTLLRALAESEAVRSNPVLRDRVQRKFPIAQVCLDLTQPSPDPEPPDGPEPVAPDQGSTVQVSPGSPPASSTEGGSRWLPWSVAGLGAATLLGGVAWDAALAEDRKTVTDLKPQCAGTAGASCDDYDAARGRVLDAQTPILLLYGVGAATAIGGVVWALVKDDDAESPSVSVDVAPGSFAVRTTLSW